MPDLTPTDPRSNLADALLTEGARHAIATALGPIKIVASYIDPSWDGPDVIFDVVDSSWDSRNSVLRFILDNRRPLKED